MAGIVKSDRRRQERGWFRKPELKVKYLEMLAHDARGPSKVLIAVRKRPLWLMGIEVHICDANAWVTEGGEAVLQGHPGLHRETLSQQANKQRDGFGEGSRILWRANGRKRLEGQEEIEVG